MSKLTKIGLGTVQFGTDYGISNQSGQTNSEEVTEILKFAKESGIRYIDTAAAYGTAEQVLGLNSLREFRVVSKFMPESDAGTVRNQLTASLDKLGLHRLYGYMAHRPTDVFQNKQQWTILQALKDEGKLSRIGFSFNHPQEIERMWDLSLHPDIVQVPFNLLDHRFEKYMPDLKEKGCEIHTRSAFLQGLFFLKPDQLPGFFNLVKPLIRDLQERYKEQLPGMLLKYVLDQTFIDAVIIGVETRQQLQENLTSITLQENLDAMIPEIDEQILMPSKWPKMEL